MKSGTVYPGWRPSALPRAIIFRPSGAPELGSLRSHIDEQFMGLILDVMYYVTVSS